MEIREEKTSMFIVALRFVGPTAFSPVANAAGAVRCEIFSTVTLPALALAIKQIPPKTTVNIVLINQTAILEPTCAKVIEKTKSLLGDRLFFRETIGTYYKNFNFTDDYIFFSRLDTDDAFHPSLFKVIHANFLNSGMPFAILSPYFANLWYPTAGDNCGDMIYNTNLRRYPIMQTSAFHMKAFKRALSLLSDKDFEHYLNRSPGKQIIPYHYEHLSPEAVFRRFPPKSMLPLSACDATLYFNVWENGVPGIIYTQTGLQSSLARRGWTNTSHLKWYDSYVEKKENPDVCKVLETYGIKAADVTKMRNLIEESHKNLKMDNINAGYMHEKDPSAT